MVVEICFIFLIYTKMNNLENLKSQENFSEELIDVNMNFPTVESLNYWNNDQETDEISELSINNSLNYLWTKIDAKDYDELMSKNSKKIIESVQILLKNRWYKIGKIDWLLVSEWQTTSKTMEAIKRFQIDEWISPVDWLPWPLTIKNLLWSYVEDVWDDVYKLINLNDKKSLTDDEVRKIVKYRNNHKDVALRLWNVKSITDEQAKIFWELKVARLEIWLTEMTDEQAKYFSKYKYLRIVSLDSITDKQSEYLSNVEVLNIWIKSITDVQSKNFWNGKNKLVFTRLESITDKQSEYLSYIPDLAFLSLKSMTDRQAENFANMQHFFVNKSILTESQKVILEKHIKERAE